MKTLFVVALLAVFAMSMLPAPEVIDLDGGRDKVWHALAFVTLAVVGFSAWPGRILVVAAGLLAYGAAIELSQAATAHRHGDMLDWFADAVGVVGAIVAWRIVARIRRTLRRRRASDRTQ